MGQEKLGSTSVWLCRPQDEIRACGEGGQFFQRSSKGTAPVAWSVPFSDVLLHHHGSSGRRRRNQDHGCGGGEDAEPFDTNELHAFWVCTGALEQDVEGGRVDQGVPGTQSA